MKITAAALLPLMIATICGAGAGSLITKACCLRGRSFEVVYVAEDELIELENARVKNDRLQQRQLFFGQIEQAVKLATELSGAQQNHLTKVVYSRSLVTGKNVRSISRQVHQQIIEKLCRSD